MTTGVVDADSHIIELPDLWTSRMPRSTWDEVPRVERHPTTNHNHWRIGEQWLHAVGYFSQAGWDRYPPFSPWELEETDPAGYDAGRRLERLDQYGIDAQVLYPNIVGFNATQVMDLGDPLSIECVKVYNDFMREWASPAPDRLLTIGMIPFWDLDAAVAEVYRSAETGHRGILFANRYERIGLPDFCEPYWDRVYAAAVECDLSVNFHIGFSKPDQAFKFSAENLLARQSDVEGSRPKKVAQTVQSLMSQYEVIVQILTSGVLNRFPSARFVSVESGFGYVPYLLECLDWHWKTNGIYATTNELPSELFRRQCYGTFWFEQTTLPMLELLPDNFMFSTDFPHPTSLSPGPVSPAAEPPVHIERAFGSVSPEVRRKALADNARRVYGL